MQTQILTYLGECRIEADMTAVIAAQLPTVYITGPTATLSPRSLSARSVT